MTSEIRLSGVRDAQQDILQLPLALRASARQAVDAAADRVRVEAIRRTSQRINLSEETLSSFVLVRRASVRADGVTGSVSLQIKAVPLSAFGAQVGRVAYTGPDSAGRRYRNRFLPTVSVSLYRGASARRLPGGFALRQRNEGPLAAGERVVRRVGGGFGGRRDGSVGNKLSGFRFYTFPKRITDQLVPELRTFAGEQLGVEVRVAYQKNLRGFRVLRRNN